MPPDPSWSSGVAIGPKNNSPSESPESELVSDTSLQQSSLSLISREENRSRRTQTALAFLRKVLRGD